MDPVTVSFVIAVVLVATVTQTVAGFGFALIAVPLFVTVLDVRDAVALTTLVGITNNAIVTRTAWRHVPWPTVFPMLGGAMLGMPLGLAVLLLAPQDALRLGVGAATVAMTAAMAAGLRFGSRSLVSEAGIGLLSGILNTSTGMNGPPVVLYMQGRDHPPGEFRGGLAVFFFVCNFVTLAIFAASGVISSHALTLAAAAMPVLAVGSLVGHAALRRIDPAHFGRLVFGLLLASALAAIVSVLV
jgi:uncharacterized membrane protein YfcA